MATIRIPTESWTDLDDTPASITANQVVRGNSGGTALEHFDLFATANTWTGTQTFREIRADAHKVYDIGALATRFDKVYCSRLVSVGSVGATTPTTGTGYGLIAGFMTGDTTLENAANVDSFNFVAGRVFSNSGASTATTMRGLGGANFVCGEAYTYGAGASALIGTTIGGASANFVQGIAFGYYGIGELRAYGNVDGAFVQGFANSNYAGATGRIRASASGAFAQGFVNHTTAGTAQLTSSGKGAMAQGYMRTLGTASSTNNCGIVASANGALAQGYTRTRIGGTGYLEATGAGSTALGYVRADGEIGRITASGRGALAVGHARDLTTNSYITASGHGSGAFGYALNSTIAATANNAFQFGVGSNALADTVKVGTAGLRFKGTTGAPAAPVNGDVWIAGGYVYIRSNGVSCKCTNAVM